MEKRFKAIKLGPKLEQIGKCFMWVVFDFCLQVLYLS